MNPINQPSQRNYNINGSTRNNGFLYKIMPLSFNLQQRGNDIKIKKYNKCKFNIGDNVKGLCIDDQKYHSGRITNILFSSTTQVPYLVYIIDNKTRSKLTLNYNSLKYNKKIDESYGFDVAIKLYETIFNDKYNKLKRKDRMVNSIKVLLEDYFNNTEQMNMLLKNYSKEQKKASKAYDQRQEFLKSILGKVTYNKYTNKGMFAPIPLSALHLTFEDFYYLFPENNIKMRPMDNEVGIEKVQKLISRINKEYPNNGIKLLDNGVSYTISSNLVFKRLDNIIDFLMIIQKNVLKITSNKNNPQVNWKAMLKKFRNYLR